MYHVLVRAIRVTKLKTVKIKFLGSVEDFMKIASPENYQLHV